MAEKRALNFDFGQLPLAGAAQQAGTAAGLSPSKPLAQGLIDWLRPGGYTWGGFAADQPLTSRLQQQQLGQNILAARGAQWHRGTQQEVSSALRGVLALMGIDWTPEVQQQLGTLLQSPLGGMVGPWLNQLTGYAFGAGGPIAEAIQRGGMARGLDVNTVTNLATAVAQAYDTDPTLRAGFAPAEMANIILEASKAGQLPMEDPDKFRERLGLLTEGLYATKSQLQRAGYQADASTTWQAFVQGGGLKDPESYARQLHIGRYAQERGGAAGLYGAAATAGGEPLRMAPQDIAAARSGIWKLLQRDWRANAAAATARIMADPELGFKPGSPGERFAAELAQGRGFTKRTARGPQPLTYTEWKQAMQNSIAAPDVTIEDIYNQSRFNKATYLAGNPMLQNAVMSQALSRWMPAITGIHRAYPGMSPRQRLLRKNALNLMAERIARRTGVASLRSDPQMSAYEKLRYITGYGPESVNLMHQFSARARQERAMRGFAQTPPLERFVQTLQQYGKEPSTGIDFAIQAAGGIPNPRFPVKDLQIPGVSAPSQGPAMPSTPSPSKPPAIVQPVTDRGLQPAQQAFGGVDLMPPKLPTSPS